MDFFFIILIRIYSHGCIIHRLFSSDFQLFNNYQQFMRSHPEANFFLIDPRSIWNLWKMLRIYMGMRISPNPPSSGFIGLAFLLPHCSYIDIVEYIPSTRLNGRCHYYDEEVKLFCLPLNQIFKPFHNIFSNFSDQSWVYVWSMAPPRSGETSYFRYE